MKHLCILFFLISSTACASTSSSRSYINDGAIQYDGAKVPPELAALIQDKRIVLIGEGHGIKELPESAFTIIESLGKKKLIVGLEFPFDIQSSIDKFLKTGKESILRKIKFFQDSEYHSGRGSKAMIQLLKQLRTLPNVEVFCFDVPKDYKGMDRDTQMAKNILEKLSNDNRDFIALTGNIHSRLVPGTPWDPNYPTMGAEILKLSNGAFNLQNSTNILFRNSEGSAWQCLSVNNGPIKCGSHSFGPSKLPYATDVPYDFYFLEEPQIKDGHINTLFIRKVTASEPYL